MFGLLCLWLLRFVCWCLLILTLGWVAFVVLSEHYVKHKTRIHEFGVISRKQKQYPLIYILGLFRDYLSFAPVRRTMGLSVSLLRCVFLLFMLSFCTCLRLCLGTFRCVSSQSMSNSTPIAFGHLSPKNSDTHTHVNIFETMRIWMCWGRDNDFNINTIPF